ncbi:MAG: hypothetical protein GXO43_05060 [Crenarchaeota archaeon]|nr:hypothetical protein [Thermoproteota archaeon]
MVAAEHDRITKALGKLLESRGYRVKIQSVTEMNLMGEKNRLYVIHAVSGDERNIVTIRIHENNTNRIRISLRRRNEGLRHSLADKLEEVGFRVTETDDEVSGSITGRGEYLMSKMRDALNIIEKS